MKIFTYCVALLTGCLFALPVFAVSLPGMTDFIEEMVNRHHFNKGELVLLFEQADHKPQIIEAISRPSTIKPWTEYRAGFVSQSRIRPGLAFWRQHSIALRLAELRYGVPQEIIVALIGVETLYGKNAGNFRVIDALTTLAFDYPRRAPFFRDELENYLLLAREQQFDLLSVRGSYAGAMGIPQFMPSSYRKYAVDFNKDHKTDLLGETDDAIGSVGNYLKEYGWIKGAQIAVRAQAGEEACAGAADTPRSGAEWAQAGVAAQGAGDETARLLDFTVDEGREFWLGYNNFEVITRYNNSDFYAMAVFQLSEALKEAHTGKAVHRW
ncbi:MAG: lytic murein transglycosylase B [Gallionella sp.]|nr:lytic murein transglycosylase B [Gallionella sp.]